VPFTGGSSGDLLIAFQDARERNLAFIVYYDIHIGMFIEESGRVIGDMRTPGNDFDVRVSFFKQSSHLHVLVEIPDVATESHHIGVTANSVDEILGRSVGLVDEDGVCPY
jgi:hypothetical protein